MFRGAPGLGGIPVMPVTCTVRDAQLASLGLFSQLLKDEADLRCHTFPVPPKPLRTAGDTQDPVSTPLCTRPFHTHYSPLTLTPTQGGGHPCSDFTAEETEVHRGYATCLRSHSGPRVAGIGTWV